MNERRRWVVRAVFTAGVVLVLVVLARVEHTTPLVLPMVLLVGTVVAIAGLVNDSGGADPTDWGVTAYVSRTSTGQDSGLASYARLLENHLSARQADPALRERLSRLTDERLSRAGLRRGDPEVTLLLGATLTDVLDGPTRTLRPAEIEECIRRIEELSP
jgi:hypothetical protein